MIRLRQKDIERLSHLTGIAESDLQKLVSMNLIAHGYAIDQLIRYSYKQLKAKKCYTPAQMTEALMREYGASRSKVQNAMYGKKAKVHYCSECMKRISALMFKRNEGLCDSCLSKRIIIDT